MEGGLVAAIVVASLFNFTNGVHDAADAVATLVATRSTTPARALALAVVFTFLGPLVLGAAVADTISKIVEVPQSEIVATIGAGMTGALVWNTFSWWRGLPSSSTHALVGGLVGAALVADGINGVHWNSVVVVLVALVVSPVLGLLTGLLGTRASKLALRRATRQVRRPVVRGQFVSAAVLAFGHGANDAAKAGGVIVALLVATGYSSTTSAPLWVTVLTAATLTLGTCVGGWRIVRTIGLSIFRLRPLDGFVCETGSALVVVGASVLGAPVSTSQVVASTVAGVGSGRRWHHVRWSVFGVIGLAWLVTFPVCLALGALLAPAWRWVT